MHRRISHIKEALAAETVNFMRTKGGRYNSHSSLQQHDDHDDAMEALTSRNRMASKMTAANSPPGLKFEPTSLKQNSS